MFKRKGQSTAEYAIILGVVIGAIMAVGVFLRGGIEGKVRNMTNTYMDQGGTPSRFDTTVMNTNYETTSTAYTDIQEYGGTTQTETKVGGATETDAATKGTTKRRGTTTYFGTP